MHWIELYHFVVELYGSTSTFWRKIEIEIQKTPYIGLKFTWTLYIKYTQTHRNLLWNFHFYVNSPFNLTLPSCLFKIALKPFEVLTCKCVTFPKYEFNMFSKKFSTIYFLWVYFSCTFRNPRPNFHSSPLLNPLRTFFRSAKTVWAIDLQICDFSHKWVLHVQSNF